MKIYTDCASNVAYEKLLIKCTKSMVEKLKKYIKRYWLTQISREELSIFDVSITTNNGAESYRSKLKARIRTCHPRIWSFLSQLNDVIETQTMTLVEYD